MNHQRLLELFWEFAEHIKSLHTLYLDCISGFAILHDRLVKHQNDIKSILENHEYAKEEFQDTCSMSYKHLCKMEFQPVAMSPLMKQGDIKARTKKNGTNYYLLGNQCVVSAYSYWEEYLRIEIGKAIGVLDSQAENTEDTRKILNKHVVSDFWGDMRFLRNCIVHNNCIANSDVSKCKLLRWFQPGQPVELDYKKMRRIFLCMGAYRNEIHRMSLSPSEGIKIFTK